MDDGNFSLSTECLIMHTVSLMSSSEGFNRLTQGDVLRLMHTSQCLHNNDSLLGLLLLRTKKPYTMRTLIFKLPCRIITTEILWYVLDVWQHRAKGLMKLNLLRDALELTNVPFGINRGPILTWNEAATNTLLLMVDALLNEVVVTKYVTYEDIFLTIPGCTLQGRHVDTYCDMYSTSSDSWKLMMRRVAIILKTYPEQKCVLAAWIRQWDRHRAGGDLVEDAQNEIDEGAEWVEAAKNEIKKWGKDNYPFENALYMTPCGTITPKTLEFLQTLGRTGSRTVVMDVFAGNGLGLCEVDKLPGVSVERSDSFPWPKNLNVRQKDAVEAIGEYAPEPGTTTVLVFMFPPPDSNVPYNALRRALERNANESFSAPFQYLLVIQECLESWHCGDENYEELLTTFEFQSLDSVPPLRPMGSYSGAHLAKLD